MTRTAVELVEAAAGDDRTTHNAMESIEHEADALDAEVARLRARVAELEAPRSPSALELAEEYAEARRGIIGSREIAGRIAELRAALVDYDKRGK